MKPSLILPRKEQQGTKLLFFRKWVPYGFKKNQRRFQQALAGHPVAGLIRLFSRCYTSRSSHELSALQHQPSRWGVALPGL